MTCGHLSNQKQFYVFFRSLSPSCLRFRGVAALKLIQSKNHDYPLVIFGQSLGGAIALRAYEDTKKDLPQVKLVIADSTFSSYKAAARSILRNHWFTWILQPITYFVLSDK